MHFEIAKNLLQKVREDYDVTSQEFSDTRFGIWKDLKVFKKYVKPDYKILDIGCGNGRLYKLLEKQTAEYTGLDNSRSLIKIAKKKHPKANFISSDALNLPFESEEFNLIFSIAMFHQIPSRELRLVALKEMKRVLKNKGTLILTSWNLWQPRLIFKYKLWHLIFGFKRKNLDKRDVYIPWKLKDGKTIKRYYHAFTLKELRSLVKEAGFKILKNYYAKGDKEASGCSGYNMVIIAQK